jgi:hypothetical protein
MQLIMLLGALRVVIVILRVYIKKANFQFSDSNSKPGFGRCAPKNKEVSGVLLNRRVLI